MSEPQLPPPPPPRRESRPDWRPPTSMESVQALESARAGTAPTLDRSRRPVRVWDLVLTMALILCALGATLLLSYFGLFFAMASDACMGSNDCDGDLIGWGVLVAAGFGARGWEGKIRAARVARENGIPYLGVCLGMQVAVVEFARHVADMAGANSSEMDVETEWPVIDLLPEQKEVSDLGGTMRLGADPVKLHDSTRAREAYGEPVIYQRHRHRYEVNNLLRRRLSDHGLVFSGTSPDGHLVEFVELPASVHPFFVATQAHPELKSRPTRPHPLFASLINAALKYKAAERLPVDIHGDTAAAEKSDAEAETVG